MLVKCPRCGNQMLFFPRKKVKGSKKKCVYCGFTFVVYSNINSHRVLSFN